MEPVLECKNICFSYHSLNGETRALSDISFQVEKGEFLAIVGPSGCGNAMVLFWILWKPPLLKNTRKLFALEKRAKISRCLSGTGFYSLFLFAALSKYSILCHGQILFKEKPGKFRAGIGRKFLILVAFMVICKITDALNNDRSRTRRCGIFCRIGNAVGFHIQTCRMAELRMNLFIQYLPIGHHCTSCGHSTNKNVTLIFL